MKTSQPFLLLVNRACLFLAIAALAILACVHSPSTQAQYPIWQGGGVLACQIASGGDLTCYSSGSNASTLDFNPSTGGFARLTAGITGAGTYLPLQFSVNNANQYRIDINGNYLPEADNTQQIGSLSKRIQIISLGTALALGGANSSATGFVRAPNNPGVNLVTERNAANSNDVILVGAVDGSNNMSYGDSAQGAIYKMNSSTNQYSMSNSRFLVGTPTINSCGSGAITSGSTDLAGEVTATGATSCALNFSNGSGFSAAPFCVVTEETTSSVPRVSTAQGNFTVAGLTSGDKFMYMCIGR